MPVRISKSIREVCPDGVGLPGPHKAWDFIRRCFDISHKDLEGVSEKTLQRFAAQEKISPALTAHVQAEIERVLWHQRLPVDGDGASPVNRVTREIVSRLLEIYLMLQQRLEAAEVDQHTALLVIVERVLVPAMAEAVVRVTSEVDDPIWHRPWIIGDEFRGDQFWYMPQHESGESSTLQDPLRRILELWLRAGGLNKGYGLAKHLGEQKHKLEPLNQRSALKKQTEAKDIPEAPKKRFERYLHDGVKPTSLIELHNYVDGVDRIEWLGGPADWKARFTLAWAVQTAGEELDRFFSAHLKHPALHFAEVYRKAAGYGLKFESYGRVSFVARLLEDDLRRRGVFKKWRFLVKMRRYLKARWAGPPPLEEVLEMLGVRQWLLAEAREQGVLSKDCISPLLPLAEERGWNNAQLCWDLILPFDRALPKADFNRFCDFALSMGLKLLKREMVEAKAKGRRAA